MTLPDVIAHACNPSTVEAEEGGLRVQGQSVLHSEFEVSLGYAVRTGFKKKKNLTFIFFIP
jgi:hypothetical protein